jgi:hypothetical protein
MSDYNKSIRRVALKQEVLNKTNTSDEQSGILSEDKESIDIPDIILNCSTKGLKRYDQIVLTENNRIKKSPSVDNIIFTIKQKSLMIDVTCEEEPIQQLCKTPCNSPVKGKANFSTLNKSELEKEFNYKPDKDRIVNKENILYATSH